MWDLGPEGRQVSGRAPHWQKTGLSQSPYTEAYPWTQLCSPVLNLLDAVPTDVPGYWPHKPFILLGSINE